MAKYEITRDCCGVVDVINVVGPTKDRQRKADWVAANVDCEDCRKKAAAAQRDAINAQAAEAAVASALPTLQGSEKQVSWATTIRDGILKQFESRLAHFEQASDEQLGVNGIANREILRNVLTKLRSTTSAKWWIDHRNDSPQSLAKLLSA